MSILYGAHCIITKDIYVHDEHLRIYQVKKLLPVHAGKPVFHSTFKLAFAKL